MRFLTSILLSLVLGLARVEADVISVSILPSWTDPAIRNSDSPHVLYVNRDIVVDHARGLPNDRHQLLLYLPGTGGKGTEASAFCSLAATQGYHVLTLMYADEMAASVCQNDGDPRAFEDFRMAIIQGGHTSHLTVSVIDSIEHRLTKALQHLASVRPREEWNQFLTKDGQVNWERIAVSGHSQGGGHAVLLGIKHRVARVICMGGPKDWSKRLQAPAAWYKEKAATAKSRFFAFNHAQDARCCTPEQQLENLRVLGLDAFGPVVDVAHEAAPYRHSHVLTTSEPAFPVIQDSGSLLATTVHVSVITNANAARWKQVWTYMLTEER